MTDDTTDTGTYRDARDELLEQTQDAREDYEHIIKQLEAAREKIDPEDPDAHMQREAVEICLAAARDDLGRIEDAHDQLLERKRRDGGRDA